MLQQLLAVLNFGCTQKAGPLKATVLVFGRPALVSAMLSLLACPHPHLWPGIQFMSEVDKRELWQHMVVASGRLFKP